VFQKKSQKSRRKTTIRKIAHLDPRPGKREIAGPNNLGLKKGFKKGRFRGAIFIGYGGKKIKRGKRVETTEREARKFDQGVGLSLHQTKTKGEEGEKTNSERRGRVFCISEKQERGKKAGSKRKEKTKKMEDLKNFSRGRKKQENSTGKQMGGRWEFYLSYVVVRQGLL